MPTSPGATTTTSSTPITPAAPMCSASCRCGSPTAAGSSPCCTPPSWPPSSPAPWPFCCSWAPSSNADAAIAAGPPRRAPIVRSRDPQLAPRGHPRPRRVRRVHRVRCRRRGLPRTRVFALAHPATKPVAKKTPYTEKVSFGYHAKAPAGPVYPDGVVKTGDPIFLKLVHRVRVKTHYRLDATSPQRLGGTMEVLLRLTSPTGWTRTIQLAAPKAFKGDYASADVILDLPVPAVADPQGRQADGRRYGVCLQPLGRSARPRRRHPGQSAAHQRLRPRAEPSA